MSKFDLFANFLQKEYNIDIKKAGLVPPRPGLKWNPVVHRWVSEESAQPPKRNRPMTLYERMRLGKSMKKAAPKISTFDALPKPKRLPKGSKKSPWPSMPASLRGTSIPEALQRPSDKKKNAYTIPDNSQYPSKKQKDTFFRTFGMKKSTPKLGTGTRFKNLARKLAVMGKK